MAKITAHAAKAKAAKYANSRSDQPTPEIVKSDPPNVKTPEALGEIAGNGGADANTIQEKAKAGFEQAVDLRKSTYATAAKGAADYNLKIIDIARINAGAAFDYARELLGVRSLPELVELSTAHARKQFEAITMQTKELAELAAKVTTEIAEPLKAGVTKAFNTQAG
jgi:phasin